MARAEGARAETLIDATNIERESVPNVELRKQTKTTDILSVKFASFTLVKKCFT
jgi:hypothetical protein